MYSPKIREDLVPRIFRTAKAAGVAMTTWVNEVLETALSETEAAEMNDGEKGGKHDPF